MKYKLVADNLIEEQAILSELFPKPIIDTLSPLLQIRAIMAAVKLGIFESIGHGLKSSQEIAEQAGVDEACLVLLLRGLCNAEYIEIEKNKFKNSQLTTRYLLSDSKYKLTNFILFAYSQWDWIEGMESVIKSGVGLDTHKTMKSSTEWETYQRAMFEAAHIEAVEIANLVPVKDKAAKLLDIGGSHGFYGAAICLKYPPMISEVLDLPQSVNAAKKIAKENNFDTIVSHRGGNALKDDLGKELDVVFMSNIVHHFTATQNETLLKKIYNSMSLDGTLAILDFNAPEQYAQSDLIGDTLALCYRITSSAQCYNQTHYIHWLEQAGFSDIKVHQTPFGPTKLLITGRKSSDSYS